MAVMKEWKCAAHGEFESVEGVCIYGCPKRFVVQEIRTAPNVQDSRTANTDQTLRALADEHGLTDMSNRNGSVMNSQRTQGNNGPDFSPRWVDIPHAKPGWSRREGETSPVVTPDQVGGMTGANVMDEFKKQGITLPGPTLAASKAAGLFVGAANRSASNPDELE